MWNTLSCSNCTPHLIITENFCRHSVHHNEHLFGFLPHIQGIFLKDWNDENNYLESEGREWTSTTTLKVAWILGLRVDLISEKFILGSSSSL